MTRERLVTLLADGAIAVLLPTLVAAAFVLPPSATRGPTTDVAVSERAAPVARHLVRDVDPMAVSIATADEPTDDWLVLPPLPFEPEPVVVAEPVPTAPPLRAPANPGGLVTDGTRSAELQMLALMNASRTAAGLVALAVDASVSETARSHSDVESRYGYVYHDGPDGSARVRDASACASGWYGENTGKVWNDNVRALHVEFMNEPWEPINHRTNIMDPAFRRVGIGAVLGRDAMYLTMVFCR